jgi:hypothetical protein
MLFLVMVVLSLVTTVAAVLLPVHLDLNKRGIFSQIIKGAS